MDNSILFLCQYFYPEYISSATLPFDTAKALAKAGFKVGAICGYPKEYLKAENVPMSEEIDSVFIRRLKYAGFNKHKKLGRLLNFFSFTLKCILAIPKILKYKNIVVYSNPPVLPIVPVICSFLKKINIVFVCYDVYPEIAVATKTISSGIVKLAMDIVNKLLYKRAKKIVALSSDMKKFLVKNRNISPDKVSVIPNWFEPLKNQAISSNNAKLKEIKNSGKFIVSYFGNLGLCQDIDTIIDCIDMLNKEDVIFLFAGHGNKLSKVKNLVNNKGYENVEIFNFLFDDDFCFALNMSNLCLVSLIPGISGMCTPSKTYGYLAAGKPVCAILDEDSDIAKDLTFYGAGISINNGEALLLSEYIKKCIDDKDFYIAQCEKSQKLFYDKYTTEICTQKYVDLFKEFYKG